jgi:hypothetical protein
LKQSFVIITFLSIALCFAVAAGDTKIVKLLLEKGANCNDKMPLKVKFLFFKKKILKILDYLSLLH